MAKKKSKKQVETPLPEKLYVRRQNDTGEAADEFLRVEETAQNTVDEVGQRVRVGIYTLTGYVDVDAAVRLGPTLPNPALGDD